MKTFAHAAFVPIPVRHETLERERDVPRAHFQRLDRAPHARVAVQTAHNPIADPVPWFQKSLAPTARPALFGRVELEVPLGHWERTNKKLHAQEVLPPRSRRVHHLFRVVLCVLPPRTQNFFIFYLQFNSKDIQTL